MRDYFSTLSLFSGVGRGGAREISNKFGGRGRGIYRNWVSVVCCWQLGVRGREPRAGTRAHAARTSRLLQGLSLMLR